MTALALDERVKLMRDGLAQNAAVLTCALINLLTVPLLLHALGDGSYGLWLVALNLAGLASAFDLGLGMSVTQEVAAGGDDASSFVASAGTAYLLLGVAGAVFVFASGFGMRGTLGLGPDGIGQAPWVFALAGAGLIFDLLKLYLLSILAGLRRFGFAAGWNVAGAAARAAGWVVLIKAQGAGVVALAGWQTFVSLAFCVVGLIAVARFEPRFGFRFGYFDWASVRSRARFALASQLGGAVGQGLWRIPLILTGLLCGSAAAAALSVAQRLPLALESVLWQMSDVLMPGFAARRQEKRVMGEMLSVGLRWTLLMALPACAGLWILARPFLEAWLGVAPPESVWIFRLTALAVLAGSAGHAAAILVWGAGLARSAVAVTLARSAAMALLCFALLPALGARGAAYAAVAAVAIGAAASLWIAASHCGMRKTYLLSEAVRGLAMPLSCSAAVAWILREGLPSGGWLGLAVAAFAAAAAYALALKLGSARDEERALARELLKLPRASLRSSREPLVG